MLKLNDQQKQSKYNAVLIGVPTFGMVSINFLQTMKMMGRPIWTTEVLMPVIGKPVDVARNEIAAHAVAANYGYVFFRDDDVNAEPDALTKLIGRLTPEQKAKPYEYAGSIVGGVVYDKRIPPSPMIFRHDTSGGFEDWNFGDLVECDSMGMGCTLIPVGVFKKILDDGLDDFICCNDYCPVNWSVSHKKDVDRCPTCKGPIVPRFFRTVKQSHNVSGLEGTMIDMTEDTYFCILAKQSGVKIFADCGVQCEHEDTNTSTIFYFHKGMGIPVWQSEGRLNWIPRVDTEEEKHLSLAKNKNGNAPQKGKVKFNVGSGGGRKDGFIDMDLSTECDFRCDARDLTPAVRKYGKADHIYASHVLEHINRTAVQATVRNWVKALKPGGVLEIITPDAKWAMEEFLAADANGDSLDVKLAWEWIIFGEQSYPLDEHRTAITEKKMKGIMAGCQNMLEKSTVKSVESPPNKSFRGCSSKQIRLREIRVRAVKKKATITKAG